MSLESKYKQARIEQGLDPKPRDTKGRILGIAKDDFNKGDFGVINTNPDWPISRIYKKFP